MTPARSVPTPNEEKYGSPLDNHPPRRPKLVRANAIVIGDAGNVRPGGPTLTTALRGEAQVIAEVRTLADPRHNGEFSGAAPDALLVLFGAQDGLSNPHAPNERVLLGELERAVVAEARFLSEYAARHEAPRPQMPL